MKLRLSTYLCKLLEMIVDFFFIPQSMFRDETNVQQLISSVWEKLDKHKCALKYIFNVNIIIVKYNNYNVCSKLSEEKRLIKNLCLSYMFF